MKWAIVNGSPKGPKGATETLIQSLLGGAGIPSGDTVMLYAARASQHREMVEKMIASDALLIVFPLYTDTMPAQLQALFEVMEENKDRLQGRPAWFAVHSGFPEACQAKAVERLLASMCPYMGLSYMGTIRTGSAHMYIQAMTNKKSRMGRAIRQVLQDMAAGRAPDKEILESAAGFDVIPGYIRLPMRLLPLQNLMFIQMLRKNNAQKHVRDRPYA